MLPDPARAHPIILPDGTGYEGTVHLAHVINHPRIEVGDYTYASDFAPPEDWAAHLAPYLFAFGQERLRIGRFCQIAQGVRFITSGSNHAMDGISTYPFAVFDEATRAGYQPDTRDTVVGHDVWLGYGALVMPGARIGNGVIVGAGAVVRGDIPDYAVVTGNPAHVTRMRFSDADIALLNSLAWWDWPVDKINAARAALTSGSVAGLAKI